MNILIVNARCIDPRYGLDEVCDVLINDGTIQEMGHGIAAKAERTIDAKGLYLLPGLMDVHVHFREPGYEHKETIATGIEAA
ncbi:MAG: dihydroorotase, partial [Candidatus Omnitrophica bacterium]|nr:dihydroorotase [Candidatus Omnitrophota bacterium]